MLQPVGAEPALFADPLLGFFGPGSQMWRINREAVLLGAGPASLLMQIAHPLVAEGVAAHSSFEADPMARLRRTLATTLGMVFGDGPTAEACVRRLNGLHERVQGDVRDPAARAASGAETYRALDPELLLWVQATLVIMSVRAYRAWVGTVSDRDADRLWHEATDLGRHLGIPPSTGPPGWVELLEWFERCIGPGGPVRVTPTARDLARTIVRPPLPLAPRPLVDLAVLPGLSLLPERLRREFGIAWSARHARTARWLGLGIRTWVALTPAPIRSMPQARAAGRRLRGVAWDDRGSGRLRSGQPPARSP